MKTLLNKLPKPIKILIGIILLLLCIGFVFNKSGITKTVLNLLNQDLIIDNKRLEFLNNKIESKRINDSIFFIKALKAKAVEIDEYKEKYQSSLKQIKQYEKALNNYNIGDFNINFITFTKFLRSRDSISTN